MAHYQTAQKKLLLNFLQAHSQEAFSIEELAARLEAEAQAGAEHAPGKSTLYRLMPTLVEEGLVKRFAKDNSRQFLYQMMGEHCESHLHLKCAGCGRILHMESRESELLVAQILKKHRFAVDEKNTIFFGRCQNCTQE